MPHRVPHLGKKRALRRSVVLIDFSISTNSCACPRRPISDRVSETRSYLEREGVRIRRARSPGLYCGKLHTCRP